MEVLHFKVHGSFITNHIRNLYYEGSIVKSWNAFSTITDNLDIFKDIIKGKKAFDGINDLTLIDSNEEDFSDIALYSIVSELNNVKDEFDQINEKMNSQVSYDGEITLREYIEFISTVYTNLKNKIVGLESNLEKAKQIFNYSEEEIINSCLKKHKSTDLSHKYGWITEKGLFIPVQFAEHDQFINYFNEKMKTNFSVANIEKRWVRITTSMCGIVAISAYNFTLKPKQSIMLEKWILHNNIIKEGEPLNIFGYGEAERTNNRVKFIRHPIDSKFLIYV